MSEYDLDDYVIIDYIGSRAFCDFAELHHDKDRYNRSFRNRLMEMMCDIITEHSDHIISMDRQTFERIISSAIQIKLDAM